MSFARDSEVEMPAALERVLTRTIAFDREHGDHAHAAQLLQHYTHTMPCMRIAQLASATSVGAKLMHAPFSLEKLPRMSLAVVRLLATLDACGVSPHGVQWALDAPSLAQLHARTYYGGCMPMLYAYPADLAYFESRGLSLYETIDRYLTAPVIHELCHLDRERDALCPHLDECVAGWLGVHAWPEFAYPEPGHDDALYASPWLAQIGAAMVRVFGLQAVLRAHAGQLDALPRDFLDASERLWWDGWVAKRPLHFLGDTFDPKPWLALICDREIGEEREWDRSIVEDALRAMCLETTQVGGSFRTRTVVPVAPIVIEPGSVSTAAKTAFDTAAPWYWLPRTVHVPARRELILSSLDEIPAIAASLVP